ncbi:MAG: SpoIID/LytB domain-containing protein [Planctomycetota bacterium]
MRRALVALLLFAAAAPAEESVRVWLRSLGDWTRLELVFDGKTVVLERDSPERVLRPEKGAVRVGKRLYAGELIWRGGKLVNRLGLENYTLGVLRGELPLKKVPVAAAGAQAIAVRSYTLHYVLQRKKGFDVDDTTQYQVYAGLKYAPDDDNLRTGVNRTRGTYLEWQGEPLKCYYHSTCGGRTTDVPTGLGRPKLIPMASMPCNDCSHSKYWRWRATLSEADVRKATGAKGPITLAVEERGAGGRATKIRVTRDLVVDARTFRLKVGPSKLRSTRILKLQGFAVEGAGWGHGVGMCQMGAIGRANAQWSAERIVSYYYPGATLVRAR